MELEMAEFLKKNSDEKKSLLELVNVFEQMCRNYESSNSMLLFETGTFNFGGNPMFYFSLVRQFPNDDEEYFQVHLDVIFKADTLPEATSEAIWDIEMQGDFFEFVRSSEICNTLKNAEISEIDVYVDET